MSNHHYPHADELSKDRFDKLIAKAKSASYNEKVALFAILQEELYKAADSANGKDIKTILSEGFTAFEHRVKLRTDQDVAEGFLHWNHLIFYKHYKKLNQPQQLPKLLSLALDESKYWLVNEKNEGALAKPNHD